MKISHWPLIAILLIPWPALAAPDAPPEVLQLCNAFFEQLKSGKVPEAYAVLLRGSKISEKLEKVADLQDRTTQMLKEYGAVLGSELIKTEFVGKNLCRLTWLIRPDSLPVRWQITFYRPADQWRVFNLQIDDAVMDFFE